MLKIEKGSSMLQNKYVRLNCESEKAIFTSSEHLLYPSKEIIFYKEVCCIYDLQ